MFGSDAFSTNCQWSKKLYRMSLNKKYTKQFSKLEHISYHADYEQGAMGK